MNPVSDAGPRAAVATAVSVAIRWLGATEGHQSRQLAADAGEVLTAMPASGPLRLYLFPNPPTPPPPLGFNASDPIYPLVSTF